MTSPAQLAANRANAQLSTGPQTAEGKAKVSLNAVKTGLTGRTVLLPSDDVEAYNTLAARLSNTWKPVGEEEQVLVRSLIDTEWRLLRIPELESSIYACAALRLTEQFAGIEDDITRATIIRGETYLRHSREFANLSIQETRLLRRRDKDTKALQQLQRDRFAKQSERAASQDQRPAQPKPASETSVDPIAAEVGFDISELENITTVEAFAVYEKKYREVLRRRQEAKAQSLSAQPAA